MTSVKEALTTIIAQQLRICAGNITENMRIEEDLGADSLDVVEMLMEVEADIGVKIPDEAIPEIKTVGDFISYIDSAQRIQK